MESNLILVQSIPVVDTNCRKIDAAQSALHCDTQDPRTTKSGLPPVISVGSSDSNGRDSNDSGSNGSMMNAVTDPVSNKRTHASEVPVITLDL